MIEVVQSTLPLKKGELYAMIRQLICSPSIFLIFSSAETISANLKRTDVDNQIITEEADQLTSHES